ncbi:MAG: 2OG-Fe(II) oxygenase [Ramlibacter sp.]|nr:2OG-Fe(II) oxygenase [Ramlibacter sp.]
MSAGMTAPTQTPTMTQIPVVDLAASFDSAAGFRACAQAIAQACADTGFFGVVGHRVPAAVIADALAAARGFFALPVAEKLRVRRERPELNRAYIGFGSETLARLAGKETPPDFKEVFTVGPEAYPEDAYHTCAAARPHWGPNRWPEAPAAFRPRALAYWDAMQALKLHLTRLFAQVLGVDADYFPSRMKHSPDQLRLIHYPPYTQPWEPGQLRAGEHTDLSLLTIVYSDNNTIGGLEVRNRSGGWVAAPDFDGFMVNLGDTMMRWCNDRWKSTPHRVVNPPPAAGGSAERMSLAFFAIPDYDTRIECLPSCTDAEHPPLYPPVTMGEYRAARFARTANA